MAIALNTACSMYAGTVSRSVCSDVGFSVSTLATIACAVEPMKAPEVKATSEPPVGCLRITARAWRNTVKVPLRACSGPCSSTKPQSGSAKRRGRDESERTRGSR